MNTVARSVLALGAAIVAPPALILVPYASDLVLNSGSGTVAWAQFNRIAIMMLVTAAIYVVLLGMPAFLLLRWRRAIRWWSTVLAGCVLGCLPIAVGNWPGGKSDLQTTASHWNGEKMVFTFVDGVPTREGWLQYVELTATFGLFGAVSGVAFWIVWRALQPSSPSSPA